jgi:uncharacterized phiE125 gp8 family phage protein
MSDFYELKTPPSGFPVDFTKTSQWCRDIDTTDTDLVNELIEASTDSIEKATNRVFIERTYTGKFSNTCISQFELYPYIEIRRSPLNSITNIKVNGDILDTEDYLLKESQGFSRILFLNSLDLDFELTYPIEVEFIAGYGDESTVPGNIKVAIQQYVLFLYENRGDVIPTGKNQFPLVTHKIVKKNRIVNSYG